LVTQADFRLVNLSGNFKSVYPPACCSTIHVKTAHWWWFSRMWLSCGIYDVRQPWRGILTQVKAQQEQVPIRNQESMMIRGQRSSRGQQENSLDIVMSVERADTAVHL